MVHERHFELAIFVSGVVNDGPGLRLTVVAAKYRVEALGFATLLDGLLLHDAPIVVLSSVATLLNFSDGCYTTSQPHLLDFSPSQGMLL